MKLKNYLPLIVFVGTAVLALISVFTAGQLQKTKQVTPAPSRAATSVSTLCSDWNIGINLPGDLISYKFNNAGDCQRYEQGFNSGDQGAIDQVKQWIGQKSVCSGSMSTCNFGITSCTTSDRTSGGDPFYTCQIATSIPSCSVVQLDCNTINGWGGQIAFNCSSCETITNTPTKTKTPTPTGTVTISITNTPTNSPTPSITGTPTNTPTGTLTITNTPTGTLTVTPSVTQTLTPTGTITLKHKACDSNKKCVEVVGAGSDSCQSDVSCQEPPVTPETPTASSVSPTIFISFLGLGLMILGLGLAL